MEPADTPIPFDLDPRAESVLSVGPVDRDTLVRAESGDRRAIEQVLREVHPGVHRVAHALAGDASRAGDVLRFVFASAMRVLPQWSGWVDPEKWFAHQALQAVRRVCASGRPNEDADLLLTAAPAGHRTPAYAAFVRAVRRLAPQQAEAFVLHYGERLNARLLGVAMDCSTQAADTHLRAADAGVRRLVGDEFPRLTATLHQAARGLTPAPADTDRFVQAYVGAWVGRRRRRRLGRWFVAAVVVAAFGVAAWLLRDRVGQLTAPTTDPATKAASRP